ncbi:MAG: beta-galactosidase, partial [Clostridia bacterium]|nr:beta-galactosidase [Clostridia bacterium]
MKRLFSYFLVLVMILSIIPQAYAAEQGTLTEWAINYMNCSKEHGTVVADSSTSRSGSCSAKATFSLPMQNNRYLNFSTIVRGLKQGAKYKCGVSVKAKQAGSILLILGWEDRHSITPLGKNFDWIDLSYYFVNTYGFTNMDFLLLVESATKSVWFDDVYFREVKEDGTLGPNLIVNGTFDADTGTQESENEQVNGLYKLYQDIESREKFTLSEIKQVLGAFKYAPVYKASGITIDGSLSEWDGYPKFGLPTKPDQYQVYIKNSNKDVDAYCQYAYDEENFYLAIYVKDDIFAEDPSPDMYWNGDSIQIAMCDVGQTYDAEFGFAHHVNGVGTVHSNTHGESVLSTIDLKTTQKGDETIYEAKIPWSTRYKDGVLPEGFLFDVIVNDNDGKNRAYCVELAPGIAEGKKSDEFPYLEFMTDKKDYYAWLQGPDTVAEGAETEYSYYLVNEGDEKKLTITTSSGKTETITVPAQSGIRRTYKPVFTGFGKQEFVVEAKLGEESIKATYDVNVQPGLDSFDPLFIEMDAMAVELKAILDECTAKGIATDYELVNYKVVERFCTIIREDFGAGEYDRAFYVYDSCKKLFEEAKASCEAYLAGTKKPQVVTRFKTGEVTIDGPMVYATTETNGVMEKRPYFFTGYGHFENAIRPDLNHFEQFGINLVQLSMDPAWGVVSPVSGNQMFKFEHNSGIVTRMKDTLKRAEEHNIQVCILLGIHDLGSTILNAYPQLKGQSVADVIVQQGDIKLHPIMKKLIDVHVQGVLETVGDSPALHSICLTNEPSNNANSDFYKPYWALYLSETYNADISALNAAYGTNYENFIDVPMPTGTPSNRWFYDYKQFNDDIVNQYHEYIASKIREIDPTIPL